MSSLRYIVAEASPYGRSATGLDLETAPDYELFFSCFMGDVDLSVNGVSFRTNFGWVATLGFALGLVSFLRDLPESGEWLYEFQEDSSKWIEFDLDGREVVVSCSYADGVSAIAYEDLLDLTRNALRALLVGLSARFPALRGNPHLTAALAEIGMRGL